MGYLDDAIREHLDLKRRHGADPTEVEQAEREALGPVRRDPFEHGEDLPEAAVADPESGSAYDQATEPGVPGDYVANGEAAHDWGDALEEPPLEEEHRAEQAPPIREEEPLPAEEPFSGERFAEEPVSAEEPFAEEPVSAEKPFAEEPVSEEPSIPRPHPAGDETAEYDVEQTFAEEAHPESPPAPPAPHEGEEDVLEETPEFLQDAPEHDRLWFEQRPPRDFDFDG